MNIIKSDNTFLNSHFFPNNSPIGIRTGTIYWFIHVILQGKQLCLTFSSNIIHVLIHKLKVVIDWIISDKSDTVKPIQLLFCWARYPGRHRHLAPSGETSQICWHLLELHSVFASSLKKIKIKKSCHINISDKTGTG